MLSPRLRERRAGVDGELHQCEQRIRRPKAMLGHLDANALAKQEGLHPQKALHCNLIRVLATSDSQFSVQTSGQ
jgi:hypothetical protein